MKFRLIVALAVVLALVLGGGLLARADNDPAPNCWWVSYTVRVMGAKVVSIPNSCIPCLGICDWLPPPPGAGNHGKPGNVSVQR